MSIQQSNISISLQVICTGEYYESLDSFNPVESKGSPQLVIFSLLILLTYFSFLTKMYMEQRNTEVQVGIAQKYIPKSIESVIMNFIVLTFMVVCYVCVRMMNR